ncbi:AraC family transcriptional regulator [Marinobacter nanhaiticus D15-8W]|uniref:AraC family transcriptional regulator n=1 Tax=Marinobacter nanhaiticus D15-8W TaxID=626887 RepID=N6WNJ5_9GAMM|nr:AraC family transcriptional regulator [Marinobacter nanhaiticus]ENO13091.1 AraC family transcriptional regulator [Marinobacter nanhaiticus D15-8W]BES70447.1 AraC family transcriptional regulator [Marinobacter nanhaiticus D15-8W]
MFPSPAVTPEHRVEAVLRHIHENLDAPLSVEYLAELAGWSRWQFQRVFNAHTGLSVAQYVRELRLSRAAEALLNTGWRQLDIALACGFCSEISFSRSFRQMFGCSPRAYRQRGQLVGLRTPIPAGDVPSPPVELDHRLLQIRLETRSAFTIVGLCDQVQGLFSECPDFATRVPRLWQAFHQHIGSNKEQASIGVLGVTESTDNGCSFPYWAGHESGCGSIDPGFGQLRVPAQTYAVIPFQGPLPALEKTLDWFIHHWLPASGYRGCYGYDLEVYPPGFKSSDPHARMEYWVPVEPDPARRRALGFACLALGSA